MLNALSLQRIISGTARRRPLDTCLGRADGECNAVGKDKEFVVDLISQLSRELGEW